MTDLVHFNSGLDWFNSGLDLSEEVGHHGPATLGEHGVTIYPIHFVFIGLVYQPGVERENNRSCNIFIYWLILSNQIIFLFLFQNKEKTSALLDTRSSVLSGKQRDGHCIWYGTCIDCRPGQSDLNIAYEGEAKPLKDQDAENSLRETCPELFEELGNGSISLQWNAILQFTLSMAEILILVIGSL